MQNFAANWWRVQLANSVKTVLVPSQNSIKTPARRYWRHSGAIIVNFEHISHLAVVFLLLTLNM